MCPNIYAWCIHIIHTSINGSIIKCSNYVQIYNRVFNYYLENIIKLRIFMHIYIFINKM